MFARQGRGTRTRRSSCCKAPWMGSPGRGKDVKGEECPSTLPCTGSLCPEERPIPALISIFKNVFSLQTLFTNLLSFYTWNKCVKRDINLNLLRSAGATN